MREITPFELRPQGPSRAGVLRFGPRPHVSPITGGGHLHHPAHDGPAGSQSISGNSTSSPKAGSSLNNAPATQAAPAALSTLNPGFDQVSKAPADIRSLARAHTETALRTLASIMTDGDAPHAARVSASSVLLDRGWGKPAQSLQVKSETTVRYVARMPEKAPSTEKWQQQHAPTLQ